MKTRLPRRILVGVSFPDDPAEVVSYSPDEHAAIEQAIWYAGRVEGEIEFVHVIEGDDETLPHHTVTLHDAIRQLVSPCLERIAEETTARGVPATWRVDEGSAAWHRLILAAKESKAELVIVSPRRKPPSALDRFLHGSTSRRLLRKCPVPVWVVEPGREEGIEKILVPVDFTEVSHRSIETADALHEISNAERHLVHCVTYPADIQLNLYPDSNVRLTEYHVGVKKAAREKIDELLGDRTGWEVHLAERDVLGVVHDAVEKYGFDLLVMGSVARTGLAGWIMGNSAEQILNGHDTSVWVMKPTDWAPVV